MAFRRPGERFVRLQYRKYHKWILPQYALCGMFTLGLLFVLVSIVFLAIGGFLTIWGAVMFVIGSLLLFILLFLCLYAYCVFELREQETQTSDSFVVSKGIEAVPTYAVVDKKPPISPDSAMRNGRQGATLPKKVTMAPNTNTGRSTPLVQYQSPQPNHVNVNQPYARQGQGHYVTLGQGQMKSQGQGYPHSQSGGQGMQFAGGQSSLQHGTPHINQQNHLQQYQHQQQNIGYHGYSPVPHSPSGFSVSSQYSSTPQYSAQQTPYSTLTQRTPAISSYSHPSSRSYTPDFFTEDYDNTRETQPMIGQSQSSSHQSWQSTQISGVVDDDIPEPSPLVYPSERRPMTFQQNSSSKMSIYDNVYSLDKLDEE